MRKSPIPVYRWEMVALLWGAFFLNQGDRQVFSAVLPLVRDNLGLSELQLGLVVTVFTIVYGVLVPVAGYAGDAFQRRWVVWLSLLTFSLGTLLTGGATALAFLIVFRSIATGAGEAFYYPAANSLLGQYHQRNRALAMSIHQTANYTGIVVGGALAAWIGQTYGWRMSFMSFGLVGVIWSCLILLRLRNDRADAAAEARDGSPERESPPLGEVLRNTLNKPTLWMLSLAFGGMIFVHIGFLTWMPTFLYEKFDLSLAQASLFSMLYHHVPAYGGVLIGAWVADRLVVRHKRARMDVEFVGLLLGAPFICLMGVGNTLGAAYLGLVGFGFFRGVYDSNLFAALFDVIDPKYHASATGIMLSIAFVVGSLSPLLLGWVKPLFGLSIGIALLGFVYVASALIIAAAKTLFFEKDYCAECHACC